LIINLKKQNAVQQTTQQDYFNIQPTKL